MSTNLKSCLKIVTLWTKRMLWNRLPTRILKSGEKEIQIIGEIIFLTIFLRKRTTETSWKILLKRNSPSFTKKYGSQAITSFWQSRSIFVFDSYSPIFRCIQKTGKNCRFWTENKEKWSKEFLQRRKTIWTQSNRHYAMWTQTNCRKYATMLSIASNNTRFIACVSFLFLFSVFAFFPNVNPQRKLFSRFRLMLLHCQLCWQ